MIWQWQSAATWGIACWPMAARTGVACRQQVDGGVAGAELAEVDDRGEPAMARQQVHREQVGMDQERRAVPWRSGDGCLPRGGRQVRVQYAFRAKIAYLAADAVVQGAEWSAPERRRGAGGIDPPQRGGESAKPRHRLRQVRNPGGPHVLG